MKSLGVALTLAVTLSACSTASTAAQTAAPIPATARPAATSVVVPTSVVATTPAPASSCPPSAAAATPTRATITLTGGTIVFTLLADKAPLTVKNFIDKSRACFYDNLTFHRVEPSFVIQGGDPRGNGTGGNQTLPTEPSDVKFDKGTVGVARGGDPKISNDAQFFICTGQCQHLNGLYTVFGRVTAGQNVADAVKVGDRIQSIRVQ